MRCIQDVEGDHGQRPRCRLCTSRQENERFVNEPVFAFLNVWQLALDDVVENGAMSILHRFCLLFGIRGGDLPHMPTRLVFKINLNLAERHHDLKPRRGQSLEELEHPGILSAKRMGFTSDVEELNPRDAIVVLVEVAHALTEGVA